MKYLLAKLLFDKSIHSEYMRMKKIIKIILYTNVHNIVIFYFIEQHFSGIRGRL